MSEPARITPAVLFEGDHATVFGAPAGKWGEVDNTDHEGVVAGVEFLPSGSLRFTVISGWRVTFREGLVIDCIDTALCKLLTPRGERT